MKRKIIIPETMEPAHFRLPELHELLRELYAVVRDRFQEPINAAFDQASRSIGFVLATTMPMTFRIGDNGLVKAIALPAASPFKGTVTDRALAKALKPMIGTTVPVNRAGDYTIYLVWPQALALKLKKDWMEPAHVFRPWLEPAHTIGPWTEPAHPTLPEPIATLKPPDLAMAKLVWESHEPAHWFDRGMAMGETEMLHVSLLNEFYPDLRLLERVTAARQGAQIIPPEVQEPAHFRQILNAFPGAPAEMMEEMTQVMRRYGY